MTNQRRDDYGLNGGGHAHRNGHDPKFTIQKAPIDPETLAIFDARRSCFAEPRRKLDRAKYMFAELCDRATRVGGPGFVRKGSVIVPDSEFARLFGVWESTIYTWKRALEFCGYVWTSKQFRSDRWPITVYHIAAIHPRPSRDTQNADGTSNASSRSAPGKVGEPTGGFDTDGKPKVWSHGARKPGQKSLPLATPHVTPVPWNDPSKKRPTLKNKALLEAVKGFDRLSATVHTGCEPQPAPADSHSPHRLSATADTGSQPRSNGAESHGQKGSTATAERGLKRVSVVSDRTELKGGRGNPPPDLDLEGWKKRYRNAFERELVPLHAELRNGLATAAPENREWFQVRLDFLKSLRMGGKPPVAAPRTNRVAPKAPEPEELTPEALMAHIEFCLENKRSHLITAEQRQRAAALGMSYKGLTTTARKAVAA